MSENIENCPLIPSSSKVTTLIPTNRDSVYWETLESEWILSCLKKNLKNYQSICQLLFFPSTNRQINSAFVGYDKSPHVVTEQNMRTLYNSVKWEIVHIGLIKTAFTTEDNNRAHIKLRSPDDWSHSTAATKPPFSLSNNLSLLFLI